MEQGLRELLLSGAANRQAIIHFPNGEYPDITSGFYSGSLKLEEILCASENLNFGECNASKFEAKIAGIDDISNMMIYVYQSIDIDSSKAKVLIDHKGREIITHDGKAILIGRHKSYKIPLFYGRVDSAELQADHINRVVTAYDELYFNRDINCAEWYSSFFEGTGSKTLKSFRDSLFNFIRIEQEEITLINDSVVLEETMSTTTLKFSDLIKSICQLNGCFGHIDRNGVFRYVFLNSSSTVYDVSDNYRSNDTIFESYMVKKIDKLQVNSEEGDIGAIVGTGDNPYTIQGNFLIWGKSAAKLNVIATRIFNIIKGIEYRPVDINLIYSEPYITVGDIINLVTNSEGKEIKSYILQNSLDFVQLFHQTLTSSGDEYRDEVVDDVNAEINQLKGRTLKITKNIDQFSVEMSYINNRVDTLDTQYSAIDQKVDNINISVGQQIIETKEYADTQAANAVATANNNTAEVLKSYSTTTQMNSAIKLSADNITSTVSKTYETKSNAQSTYTSLSSSITQTANQISQKVSKGDVVSEINQSAEQITLKSNRLVVESTNFKLTADGTMTCNNGMFVSGSENGGTISISSGKIIATKSNEEIFRLNSNAENGEIILNSTSLSVFGEKNQVTLRTFYDYKTDVIYISGPALTSSSMFDVVAKEGIEMFCESRNLRYAARVNFYPAKLTIQGVKQNTSSGGYDTNIDYKIQIHGDVEISGNLIVNGNVVS